jgi:apolipoprotein N-acyltransferase
LAREAIGGPWRRVWPWLAAGLSGLLLALAYPPFEQDWLAWVGLTPLLSALWLGEQLSGRREHFRLLGLGGLTGAVFFLVSLSWVIEVTTAGWVALSLYCALYPAIFAWVVGWALRPNEWTSSRANLLTVALGASVWVATEWLRSVLFTGFGWNPLAVVLWQNVAMLQITDVTGPAGLSFVIAAVNFVLVLTLWRLRIEIGTGRLRAHYDFGLTLAMAALVFTYGIRQLLAPAAEMIPLRIAAVQANIPQEDKWDPAAENRILAVYENRSRQALALQPDLLLWPEASTPRPVLGDRRMWDLVSSLAAEHAGDFLLGTVHFDEEGDFNSALLLTEGGEKMQIYHKMHLVPFGEFIPFRHSFPVFAWIVGDLVPEDFDRGTKFELLELAKVPVKLAPLICFEDTLPNLARQFVPLGAQAFVNLTNDGWFRESAGSRQHLANAVGRAAENKIPLIRAANTGITGWVDRHGRVREILTDPTGWTFIEGVLFTEVLIPAEVTPTFYSRHGDWFSWGCLVLTGLILLRRLVVRSSEMGSMAK